MSISIIGTAITGSSSAFLIPGIVLTIYGYNNHVVCYSNIDDGKVSCSEDWSIFYLGIVFLGIGSVILMAGIPIMIIGWAIRAKLKRNFTFFINSEEFKTKIGICFKI